MSGHRSPSPDLDLELEVLAQVAQRREAVDRSAGSTSTVARSAATASRRSSADGVEQRGLVERRRSSRSRSGPGRRAAGRSARRRPSRARGAGGISTVLESEPRGDRAGVQRARAAERDERELARVEPALDPDEADRVRHLLVGDLQRRARGLDARRGRGRSPRLSKARAPPRGRGPCAPPRKYSRLSRPSTRLASVSVGSVAAAPVGDRPGSAPALCGPTRSSPPRSTQAIDPPPAPIVFDRDARDRHRDSPGDVELRRVALDAVRDHADVAAGPAHVERERRAAPRPRRRSAVRRSPRRPGPRAGAARAVACAASALTESRRLRRAGSTARAPSPRSSSSPTRST